MRLVYISSSEYPHPTANGVQVVKQCNAFSRIIGKVLLLARYADGAVCSIDEIRGSYQIDNQVKLVLMPWRNRLNPVLKSMAYPLWAALKTPFATDYVYGRHLLSLLVTIYLKKPRNVFFECHTPPKGYQKIILLILVKRPSFKHIVVISDALKNILLRQHPHIRTEDVTVKHDGCDPHPSCYLKPSTFSVGYVGAIYQGRGLDLIVKLAMKFNDVDFHIVGGDLVQLRNVTGLDIPVNVICHGRVSQAELPFYYNKFSVALAPYSYAVGTPDGTNTSAYMSPLKIFEYMGWGKVVLASDLPVLREVLTDRWNSLLVTPDCMESWETALHLMRDDEIREKYSRQAYKDAVDKFSWDQRASMLLGEAGYRVE